MSIEIPLCADAYLCKGKVHCFLATQVEIQARDGAVNGSGWTKKEWQAFKISTEAHARLNCEDPRVVEGAFIESKPQFVKKGKD